MKPCLRDTSVGCHTESGVQKERDEAERSGSNFGDSRAAKDGGQVEKRSTEVVVLGTYTIVLDSLAE